MSVTHEPKGGGQEQPTEEQPRDALGRFSDKLTPEVRGLVVDALRAGAPPEVACAYAGVVRKTYYNWLGRGREAIAAANGDLGDVVASDPYAQFAVAVDNALAQFVVGNMTRIGIAGRQEVDGQWQALAWQLERRFPAYFSRRTRHEVTGANGEPLRVEHAIVLDPGKLDGLPLERKLLLAEILAEMDGDIIEAEPLGELGP